MVLTHKINYIIENMFFFIFFSVLYMFLFCINICIGRVESTSTRIFSFQISTYPSAILPESSGLLFRIIWLAFPNLSACLFESSGLFKRTLNVPCPLLPRTYPVATPYLLRTFRLVCICFKTILQLSKKLSIVKYQL